MVRGMERGRNLYGGWGQKSVGETLSREVATCGTRGAGLGVGGCWWRCRLPAAGSPQTRAPEESAPCSQEGARLGEGRQFRA